MNRTSALTLATVAGACVVATSAPSPTAASPNATTVTTSPAARGTTTCASDQVVVIGHRGVGPGTRTLYGVARSEDTVGAFKAAMRAGADGFETDFWRTADGHVVSHHDSTLARMTNGTGEIRRRTSGYVGGVRNVSGARVPSFSKVLKDMAPAQPYLQQEFKDGGVFSDVILTRLAQADRDHVDDVQIRILLTTSQLTTLRRFHRLLPDFPVGLIDRSSGRPLLSTVPTWVDVILIEFGAGDAGYIRRAGASGHRVSLRKVNTVAQLRQAVEMGAARVVTDRPEVVATAC